MFLSLTYFFHFIKFISIFKTCIDFIYNCHCSKIHQYNLIFSYNILVVYCKSVLLLSKSISIYYKIEYRLNCLEILILYFSSAYYLSIYFYWLNFDTNYFNGVESVICIKPFFNCLPNLSYSCYFCFIYLCFSKSLIYLTGFGHTNSIQNYISLYYSVKTLKKSYIDNSLTKASYRKLLEILMFLYRYRF